MNKRFIPVLANKKISSFIMLRLKY